MENLLLADEIVCVASIFALGFFAANSAMTEEEQKEFDQNFGAMAEKQAKYSVK